MPPPLDNYFPTEPSDLGAYLAGTLRTDDFIRSVVATCDYGQAKKRGKKRINLAFDEWNVWSPNLKDLQFMYEQPWQVAPPLCEEPYTHQDTLMVGLMLITLLRHADRVRIGCMAQLVNTIAPIRTGNGGGVVRETIYYPMLHASLYGRGTVLDLQVRSPAYANPIFDSVPYLDAVAVRDEETEQMTVFAVNRSQEEALRLEGDLRGMGGFQALEHLVLEHPDPLAANTLAQPDVVTPHAGGDARLDGGQLGASLPPLSWNVIRLARAGRA